MPVPIGTLLTDTLMMEDAAERDDAHRGLRGVLDVANITDAQRCTAGKGEAIEDESSARVLAQVEDAAIGNAYAQVLGGAGPAQRQPPATEILVVALTLLR